MSAYPFILIVIDTHMYVQCTGAGYTPSHNVIIYIFAIVTNAIYKFIYNYICIHTYVSMLISTTVISKPDDVTVCEGGSTTFTCVLDSSISSDDVQWYRLNNG